MTAEAPERKRPRMSQNRGAGAAKLPPAIHWHEGMLLAPQHFQTASLRNEALAYYHTAAASPFHWGLMELDRSFSDGILSVNSVEAVMPDGLLVRYPELGEIAREGDLSIDLNKLKKDMKEGKQTVYLAVTSHQPGKAFQERYDILNKKLPDTESGIDDLELRVLRPRVKLVLEDDLPSTFSGFPLMKVSWDDAPVEDKTFEPPWLHVTKSTKSRLYRICADVATQLRDTATSLERRVDPEVEASRGTQLLSTRLLIHAIASNLPAFEVLLSSGVAHPFALYLMMASLLGNLSVGAVPAPLAPYDHDNSLPAFAKLGDTIKSTLDGAVKKRYADHPFRLENGEFRLRVDASWLTEELVLGLTIPRDRDQREVEEWAMGSVMGASGKIDSLRRRRVTGLTRVRLREHELIPTAGVTFYSIERPYGDLLVADEDLVIANSGEGEESRPEKIVLYVKTKD
jgi:type VI secretion system protein ImpJ